MIGIVAVDARIRLGLLHRLAQEPDAARISIGSSSTGPGLERISPADQAGTHDYQLSPDAKWAIDRYSAFDTVPTTSSGQTAASTRRVRMLAENKALRDKLEKLEKVRSEFFRVDIG